MTASVHDPVRAYESGRRFQLWRYEVGHSQLLLRSVKTAACLSRIDVLFKAVTLIQLPTAVDGLIIEHRGDAYALAGQEWSGSVMAGACFVAEDDGEYFDPSPFESSF